MGVIKGIPFPKPGSYGMSTQDDIALEDSLRRFSGEATNFVIDGWNTTTGQELTKGTVAGFNTKFFGVGSGNSVQTGSPTHYLKSGLDSNYDVVVDVWPIPVTGNTDTLKFQVYVPQADLAASATVPLVPQNLLVEETIARALNERGDETAPKPAPGETFIMQDLLDSAIAADQGADQSEQDWQVE